MIEDFLRTVAREESELLATGLDGLRGVKVLEAAYKSAKAGHPVSI
jgi:predicted dehydrogenase